MMNSSKQIDLVLLGPPGAGKGTQADLLTDHFGLLHVSTGDMLREAVSQGTEVGKEAEKFMNRGELVPDEIVTRIVIERLTRPDAVNGVIFDGYPRTEGQAKALDEAMDESGRELDMVLYLETSEEVCINRLAGRRVCPECGKNYHMTNMPPENDEICDKCGVELYQREDDRPETVKNRLEVYSRQTRELVEYYSSRDLLRRVNGDLSADELFEKIDSLFRSQGLTG